MTTHHLLHHFAPITEAPAAVARLRQLVLDLAVRGKLVAQEPTDEPASELLKAIQRQKKQLTTEGKIRNPKPLPPIDVLTMPFDIPSNWQWERLGNYFILITDGVHVTPDYKSAGIPFLSVNNIQNNRIIFEGCKFINQELHEDLTKRCKPEIGDILLGKVGSLGVCDYIREGTTEFSIFVQLALLKSASITSPAFSRYLLLSPTIQNTIREESAGTVLKYIGVGKISNIVVPIPPLAEQQRIVAKVDELMTLCDELAAAQSEREAHRDRLVAATLHRLTTAPADDPAPFPERARFYFNHLPRLTTRAEHIQGLRQTILNLAVQGKLVPQDPHDEPASELLKRIEAKRASLFAAGEISKPEPLTLVDEDSLTFTLPSGWQTAPMSWLALKLGAGSTPLGGKSVYQEEGVPFLRSQNVHNDGLRLDDVALIPRTIHERMSGTHIQQQDLLLNITGASIGRCALVPSTFIEGNVSQHVAIVRLFEPAIRKFIHLSLISPFYQQMIMDVQVGVSREGLSMQRLKLFPMVIPPLAEQQRIVARVDELLTLCDELAANLDTVTATRRRLLEAALAEALAAA